MLLSLGLGGIPHVGSDVGGFFDNPDTELLVRWYQAGAYHPFYRAHAHIQTKRREPWLFGEPHTTHIRDAVRSRYRLLPYWYTVARESNVSGVPMMRPMFFEFPKDESVFAMEDQFMLGSAILVKPVTEPHASTLTVYLPSTQTDTWYNLEVGTPYKGGQTVTVAAPISNLPVFQRGGTIVPKRERARRSSTLMARDPFTLVVALNSQGEATGELYLDDGETYNFQTGAFTHRRFTFSSNTLSSVSLHPSSNFPLASELRVERIIIRGLSAPPTKVTKTENGTSEELSFQVDQVGQVIIRKPWAVISNDWKVELQ
jgi:alpha 1,3-glucosidase